MGLVAAGAESGRYAVGAHSDMTRTAHLRPPGHWVFMPTPFAECANRTPRSIDHRPSARQDDGQGVVLAPWQASKGWSTVPVFMIERRYAEEFFPDAVGAAGVNLINDDEDVRWLYSFLSADNRKSYCLYEAESAEAIRRAAVRAGLPADVVIEVGSRVDPDGSLHPVG